MAGRILGLLVVAALLASTSALGRPPASQPALIAQWKLGEFDEPITIPVRWMGADKVFVLDTGSSFSVVDEAAFEKLESAGSVDARTASGTRPLATVRPPDLALGPFNLRDCGVV